MSRISSRDIVVASLAAVVTMTVAAAQPPGRREPVIGFSRLEWLRGQAD